ncbi:pickpocket protein 28-like [Culex pipiens pallens]|uniref:pickpocket protein 28-like n=1 Tax=Culex pipiens pallens TaxID=42434 RepID=UPI0019537C5E|nr:pickpocket protein 28-like [Culex pipiens pallens]
MFQTKVQTHNKLSPYSVFPFYIKEFQTPKQSKSRNPLTTLRKRTGDLFREYCSHSSIHGINYIGSAQRSRWERLWWVAMLILSIYGCARLIQNIYYRWDHKPVIVSFDEKPTSVLQIPFPAVTICPETKFRPECLNFSALSEKFFEGNGTGKDTVNEEEIQTMLSLIQICDRHYSHGDYQTKLAKYNLHDWFKETLTDEGICYTFNLLPQKEIFREENLHKDYHYSTSLYNTSTWSSDDGYNPQASLLTFPSRILGSGFESGIYLQLQIPTSYEDYHCREAQGFKVLLHSPAEYPVTSKKFLRLTFSHEVTIVIKPEIMLTSKSLHSYTPSRRRCFFSHERKLQFFAIYNQANCELECLTNYTRKLCSCVRFSMPHDRRTKVCESYQLECCIQAENEVQLLIANEGIGKESLSKDQCRCLPACNSIEFDTEVTQTKYDFLKSFELRYKSRIPADVLKNITSINFAKLAIYFKQAQYMAMKRNELFGWTDFIANCGGVLGLCMGVSLLSLVELLYYCLVRPVLMLRQGRESLPPVAERIMTVRSLY